MDDQPIRECTQCGKCCIKYGPCGLGMADDEDLARWVDRPDIMQFIVPEVPDLWVSPTTGEETSRCPWLRKLPGKEKYNCRIHAVRPNVCRGYPVDSEQAIRDGCEMYCE